MPRGSEKLTMERKNEIIQACASLYETMGFKDIKSIVDSFLWVADAESPITYEELVTKFIDFTGFNYLLGLKNSSEKIKRIAFVAGSGSSEFHKAIELGVDCFVTGDCPHHVRLDLNRYKINYIEVPHEIEEKGFLLGMSEILSNIDNSFNIKKYRFEKPFELLGVAYDK